jgi:LysR family carnitine catabolism transcriptional activator
MEFTSRQLRAFQLVAQHHSFTRAAEALFITVSGLSVLIRELENQLGFRLFDRTTRQVVLTEYGNDLLAITRKTLPELDAAMSRIGRAAKGGSQSISVGTTPMIAANILPQAIKEFRSQRSDLRIQLFDADLTTLFQRLEAGNLDMAVGMVWFKGVPGFQRTALCRFSLMVIRADKIGAPHRASTTWSALNGQTLISLSPTVPHQQIINKYLAKTGAVCERGAVVNLLDTQIALVEADEGIAVIPSYAVPVCRNRKVVMSRLINPIVGLEFSQITTRARKLPPGADEFSAFLKTYGAGWPGHAGVLY